MTKYKNFKMEIEENGEYIEYIAKKKTPLYDKLSFLFQVLTGTALVYVVYTLSVLIFS